MTKMTKMMNSIEFNLKEFITLWDSETLKSFLEAMIPLVEMYDIKDEKEDWIAKAVGEENEINVCLIRTAYLISYIAENHGHKLTSIRLKLPKLYKKLEAIADKS